MKTLQNLRDTLDQHAGDTPADGTAQARVTSVRARAVRLRRRRSGAVVAAAAALVAVVAVSTALPGGLLQPASQDRTLLGREAPAEMSALGYTYAFTEGVENDSGASSLELEPSDVPRLITWAAEDADSAKLVSPGPEVRVSRGVDFDDWLVVPPRFEGTYTVREGATALAVYELTDDRPAGVTVDGITYREEVADAPLLGAEVGTVGESELAVTFEAPQGQVELNSFCAGAARSGAWVHIDFDGEKGGFSSGPSCNEDTFDPGSHGASTLNPPGRPGDQVTARIYLTDGNKGPRVSLEGVRLGLGIYEVPPPAEEIPTGYGPRAVTEYDGHRWAYQRTVTGGDTGSLVQAGSQEEPVLVVGSFRGATGTRVRFNDGQNSGAMSIVGNGGGMYALLASPDQQASLGVRGTPPSSLKLAFAIYERLD